MAEQFYTILTDIGKAKIANSQVLGTKVNMTAFAVGDGSGAYYNPVSTQTALKNEVWRGSISKIETDESNPNWIVIEAVIPTTDGGFMVREAAIFDAAGDMIAIGKHAETYKPVVSEGSAKDLFIRMILEVSNTSSVTLKVDPAVVLATKQDVNAIAGAGRTTETVKGNADAIVALEQNVSAQLADIEQDIGTEALNTTAQNIKAAVNELEARPQKDMDNGRYQSEFGWDGAVLNNCTLNNNTINLWGDIATINSTGGGVGLSYIYGSRVFGERLGSNFGAGALDSITVNIVKEGSVDFRLRIIDVDDNNKVLYSEIIKQGAYGSGNITFTLNNLPLPTNHKIDILFDTNNTGDSINNRINISRTSSDLISNATLINLGVEELAYDLQLILKYYPSTTSGTATKTITPSDIKKWGNAKFDKTTPANTNVVCDVLKSDGTVLKSNVTSLQDLSDIDITANPTIKARWTLTRNSISDTSPTVSNPSMTWEGEHIHNDGAWEYITTQTIASDVAQIDVTGLSAYRLIRIKLSNIRHSGTSGAQTLRLKCNGDNSVNYNMRSVGYMESGCSIINSAYSYVGASVIFEFDNIADSCKTFLFNGGYNSKEGNANTWNNITDTITTITLFLSSNLIKSGAKVEVWGCE